MTCRRGQATSIPLDYYAPGGGGGGRGGGGGAGGGGGGGLLAEFLWVFFLFPFFFH